MKTVPDPSKNSRDLARVVTWAAALSMGAMAALVASVQRINPEIQFKFSVATVVAFLGAGFLTAMLFQRLLGSGRSASMEGAVSTTKHRGRLVWYSVGSLVATIGAMAYGLRNVSHEKQFDVVIGAAMAVAVLSFIGWLGWRAVRFFEADDRRNLRQRNESDS